MMSSGARQGVVRSLLQALRFVRWPVRVGRSIAVTARLQRGGSGKRRRQWAAGTALPLLLLAPMVHAAGKLPVVWNKSVASVPIDVDRMTLAFAEDFDSDALNGPKTFAPVHAPYGAGTFDRPESRAYQIRDGILTLRAYRQDGRWHSGSVQTADAQQAYKNASFAHRGYACRDCYFEARLRFPKDRKPGIWAAFWLLSPDNRNGHVEIDVIEWYGGDPKGHHQGVHIWPRDHAGYAGQSNYRGMLALTDGAWHSYGARLTGDRMLHIYMDRQEIAQAALPAQFDASYYPVVTLAVLPKEAAIAQDPLIIEADYIRAYRDR